MKSMYQLVFMIWSKYASISRLRLGFICFVVVWESICCHKCLWRLASSVCGLARSHLPTFTCAFAFLTNYNQHLFEMNGDILEQLRSKQKV